MSTTPAPDRMDRFYRGVRAVARFWLWFLFRSVDVRHPERVPVGGPILLCVNHPNNFIDSLVVGSVVRRKVHYLATASMFRNKLMARFLLACGAIPVYRRQDDPGKMDKNLDTFAACFTTFARGRLVAIYPEGTTHAEARVQRIKTGAARIALEYEASHPGELRMIPVGLSFEARKSFRSRVLVAFGEPIQPAAYLRAYREDPVKAVDALTRDLQWAMEAQVVNVERIDDQRLVHAVEELYRDDLTEQVMQSRGLRRRDVDPVRLSRSIADAVAHFKAREPERVESLWQSIQAYRSLLAQYHRATRRCAGGASACRPAPSSSTPGTRSPVSRCSATARSSTPCPTTCRAGSRTGWPARKPTTRRSACWPAWSRSPSSGDWRSGWSCARPGHGGPWPSRSRCRSRARSRIVI